MSCDEVETQTLQINKYCPEVIGEFPSNIQRLMWLSFHYLHWIKVYEKAHWWHGDEKNAEKLDKYIMAYERVNELIKKLCKKRGLGEVSIFPNFSSK